MNYRVLAPEAIDLSPGRLTEELALALDSLKAYGVPVKGLGLVQAKEKATVWRVETPDGPKALKWVGRKGDKAAFSVWAHHHLESQGFPVPHLAKTRAGELYLTAGDRIGFLADWIVGRRVLSRDPGEWRLFLRTLAEFHRLSKGFSPPRGIRVKTKLGGWPLAYRAKIDQMKQWLAAAGRERDPYQARYRAMAPRVIESGERLLDALTHSDYWGWVDRQSRDRGLCHCDFGPSNTVLARTGPLYVIDMDTVAYDLPVRDLRKLFDAFLSPDRDPGAVLRGIVETYTAFQPLSPKEREVLLIDLRFPYKFYENAQAAFALNQCDAAGLEEEFRLALAREEAVRSLAGGGPAGVRSPTTAGRTSRKRGGSA